MSEPAESELSKAIRDLIEPIKDDLSDNSAFLMIATGDPTGDKIAISTRVNIPDAWDDGSVVGLLARLIDRVAEHRGWDVRSLAFHVSEMISDREANAMIEANHQESR
jgi:hypothetical protein